MAAAAASGAQRSAWRPVLQFGMSTLLLSLLLSLAVAPWLDLSWWSVFRRCVSLAAALSLWLTVKRFERRSFRSYGFAAGGAGKRQLLFGILLGLGTLGVLLAVGLLSGVCRIRVTPDTARLWRTVLGFLPAAVLVSVLEEAVFRGIILQPLLTASKAVAVLVSSGLYALVHLKTAALDLAAGRELLGLFLLGGVLALSYLLTGQLYLAVGLHAALAYGARVNKLLMEFLDPSRAWLTGTSRLVNGVAGWVALLGIAGMVLWWTRSSRTGGAGHARA